MAFHSMAYKVLGGFKAFHDGSFLDPISSNWDISSMVVSMLVRVSSVGGR